MIIRLTNSYGLIVLRCTLMFISLIAISMPAYAITLEKRVIASSDDAEEHTDGSVSLTSSDLEMAFDSGGNQLVGMRFTDLGIPVGATIQKAYIQFDVDEVTSEATFLNVQGELTGSAATFSSTALNISTRDLTSSVVAWNPPAWNTKHAQTEDQQTPDLSGIIQEILSHPNWNSGNAMAIIITGSGERTAESYNGKSGAAPLLHIEYSGGQLVNSAPDVDAGSDATIVFPTDTVSLDTGSISDDDLPSGTLLIEWSVDSSSNGGLVTFSPTANIENPSATFSEIGTYVLRASATDGILDSFDTVTINVLPEGTATTTVEKRISRSSDDAEERASGSMSLSSSDLEMTFDGGNQMVGMRFTDLDIPNGALIQNAYVQFDVDEVSTNSAVLYVQAEATDSAEPFTSSSFNISSRDTTSAIVWEPEAWNTKHAQTEDQQTPDIAGVIQEIVLRPGWTEGNAIAVIIDGTGERVAESYNGAPNAAPILHIEYSGGTPSTRFDDWAGLNLKLDGLDVGTDSYNSRLLAPLEEGFEIPQTLNVMVEYVGDGVSLGFDSGPMTASGDIISLTARYGSSIPVDLYLDGVLTETYTLVFTNLTVIELAADEIVDEPKLPGTFKLTSPDFGQVTGVMLMGVEHRGSTSQRYEKKSFSIEIRKDDDPEDERKLALLDLRKDGDWILDATYRDNADVRNIVSMDIYNDMRDFAYIDSVGELKGQAAIRGHQVEVILNERYHGTFILEEKVDRKLLDMDKANVPEDAEGNDLWDEVDFDDPENGTVLYKADANDADLYFPISIAGAFEQKYPKADDIYHYEPLQELIDFINDATDQEFIDQVGDIVDIDSAVDFWIMTNLTLNKDSLKKNYYLARNKTEKWFFVPWDNDATFGMYWNGNPYTSTSWWDPGKNNLIRRLSELPATGFNTRVKERWIELRATLFTTEALIARFITYRADSVPIPGVTENARTRNFERWPDSGGEGADNPELGTILYIEDWIADRIEFLDERIMEQPEG